MDRKDFNFLKGNDLIVFFYIFHEHCNGCCSFNFFMVDFNYRLFSYILNFVKFVGNVVIVDLFIVGSVCDLYDLRGYGFDGKIVVIVIIICLILIGFVFVVIF